MSKSAKKTDLEQGPFSYRLAQRRSPIPLAKSPGELPYRPFMIVLLDETRDLVLGSHISEQPLDAAELSQWLQKTLRQPQHIEGPAYLPRIILVENQAVEEALHSVFRDKNVEIQLNPESPSLDRLMDHMEQEMGHILGPCLVDSVGRELAVSLFRASADFLAAQPWDLVNSSTPIEVTLPTQPQPWAAVVMGSGGEEFGLVLYDSLAASQRALAGSSARCSAAMNLSPQVFLRPRDHQILDELNLDMGFSTPFLPWIVGDIVTRNPLAAETARHLLWVLRHLPGFLRGNPPIQEGGYSLSWAAQPDGPSPDIEAFTKAWKKKGNSVRAREMAASFLLFLEMLQTDEESPEELELHRRNCQRAGLMILHESRGPFDPEVFFTSPLHRARFNQDISPNDADWQSYCQTWKLLADFYGGPAPESTPEPEKIPGTELLAAWIDFWECQTRAKRHRTSTEERLHQACEDAQHTLDNLSAREQKKLKQAWLELATAAEKEAALPTPEMAGELKKMMEGFAGLVKSL